ncbi:hypothetical protein ACFRAQ_13225 [Nocardia sp. NPDC056611]|uniref:hypothetical protein n=1 Tax=Nocardia sp. NPDC056611 TaxID=3345877 RepID=UPI0036701F64
MDWMVSQLPVYDLRVEPGSRADEERPDRLLSLAESVEHELSRENDADCTACSTVAGRTTISSSLSRTSRRS